MKTVGAPRSPKKQIEDSNVNGTDLYSSGESEDDTEAIASLATMREATRQDAEDQDRHQIGQGTRYSSYLQPQRLSIPNETSAYTSGSESDGPPVDLSAMGGGFDAHMSCGDPNVLSMNRNPSVGSAYHGPQNSQTVSSSGSFRKSGNASDTEGGYYGSLTDPNRPRRQIYDEGDDTYFVGEMPDIFYHPRITNRPFPPPHADTLGQRSHSSFALPYPLDWQRENALFPSISPPAPPRHTSLIHRSSISKTRVYDPVLATVSQSDVNQITFRYLSRQSVQSVI